MVFNRKKKKEEESVFSINKDFLEQKPEPIATASESSKKSVAASKFLFDAPSTSLSRRNQAGEEGMAKAESYYSKKREKRLGKIKDRVQEAIDKLGALKTGETQEELASRDEVLRAPTKQEKRRSKFTEAFRPTDTARTIEKSQKAIEKLKKKEDRLEGKVKRGEFKELYEGKTAVGSFLDSLESGTIGTKSYLQTTGGSVLENIGFKEAGANVMQKGREKQAEKQAFDAEYRKYLSSPEAEELRPETLVEMVRSGNGRFLGNMVAESLPTIATTVAVGAPLAAVSAPAAAVATALSAATISYGATYQDIEAYEAETGEVIPKTQKELTSLATAIATAPIEALGQFRIFKKIAGASTAAKFKSSLSRKLWKYFLSFGKQGAIEGSTEVLQTGIENLIAQTYDEDREIKEGVKEAGLTGFFTGGLIDVMVSSLTSAKKRLPELKKELAEQVKADQAIPEQDFVGELSGIAEQVRGSTPLEGEIIEPTVGQEVIEPTPEAAVVDTQITEEATPTGEVATEQVATEEVAPVADQEITVEEAPQVVDGEMTQKAIDEAVTEQEDALTVEARKYDSAEEFVGSHKLVFRATDKDFDANLLTDDGLFVSPKRSVAERYLDVGRKIDELYIAPSAKILTFENTPKRLYNMDEGYAIPKDDGDGIEIAKYAKAEGFDVVEYGVDPQGLVPESAIVNKDVVRTKSQLTDTWNQANKPTQDVATPEKPVVVQTTKVKKESIKKPVESEGKLLKSKAFQRVVERLDVAQEDQPEYNRMNLAKDAARAYEFVEKYPKRAQKIALGLELPPSGITQTAISLAASEIAQENGDTNKSIDIEKALSMRATRLGQEIVALRMRGNDGLSDTFVKKLLSARLTDIGKPNIAYRVKSAISGTDARTANALEKISDKKEEVTDILSNLENDITSIIDDLTC